MNEPQELTGIYYDLAPETYYASRAIGASQLKAARRSLAHMLVEREDTDALRFGRALHCAALEPARFAERYLVAPDVDRRTNVGKAAWAQFQREAAGREVLSQSDRDRIDAMAAVAAAHPAVRWLAAEAGHSEVSGFWTDPATGVACRMRLDRYLTRGIILDLKGAKDASPEGFARAVHNYGYHMQEAHYRAGCEVLGLPVEAWVFVAQETEPPYAVAAYTLDPAAVQLAHEERARVLQRVADAQKVGRFPAYSDDILPINLPAYAYRAAPTA